MTGFTPGCPGLSLSTALPTSAPLDLRPHTSTSLSCSAPIWPPGSRQKPQPPEASSAPHYLGYNRLTRARRPCDGLLERGPRLALPLAGSGGKGSEGAAASGLHLPQGPYRHETAYAPAGCCRIGTGSRRHRTCRALRGERERPFEGPHKPQRLPAGSLRAAWELGTQTRRGWCPRGSPSLASEGEAGEEGATDRGRRPVTGRRVQPRGIYRGLTVCQAPFGRWGRRRAERIFSAPQPTSLSLSLCLSVSLSLCLSVSLSLSLSLSAGGGTQTAQSAERTTESRYE